MDTTEKSRVASKSVLMNILKEYSGIIENISVIIKESGVKARYIAKRLDIPESTFYHKKRNKTFSYPEVKKIVEMLDDNDEFENDYLVELAESRQNDEIVGVDELIKALRS
ncbi:MAG: hypothetical protein LBU62_08435 [Bacteroidales bacterium]|jgi:predicted transcriptional regulator|nr:hypothetical protein [Bacteroidales bacterium]